MAGQALVAHLSGGVNNRWLGRVWNSRPPFSTRLTQLAGRSWFRNIQHSGSTGKGSKIRRVDSALREMHLTMFADGCV